MGYVVWESKDLGNSCSLLGLQGIKKVWQLTEGIPRAKGFEETAHFKMDPDRPKNVGLTDSLLNVNSLVIASGRLKGFLESQDLPAVEYLPVKILDHKGRAARSEYFIVHPIAPQDCLDLKKSGAEMNPVDKDKVLTLENLVIAESKVDKKLRLFRLKQFVTPVLVERSLAEQISKEGFKGIVWVELNAYGH